MAQIGPTEAPATGGTAAALLDGAGLLGVLRIFNRNPPGPGKQIAAPGVAGRHDAIEDIGPAPDPPNQIAGRPHPHDVAGLLRRKKVRRGVQQRVRLPLPLPQAQASDGITVEIEGHELPGAFPPQILESAPLDDAEERLVPPGVGRPRSLRPYRSPAQSRLRLVPRVGKSQRFVENHGDVGAKRLLNLHRALGGEIHSRPVEVALKNDPLVGYLGEPGEAEKLITAAVGEDGAPPAHERMEPAQPGDKLRAGAQGEMVGVGQDDLGAHGGEIGGVERLDRGLGPHRHEGGRVHRAVRGLQEAKARLSTGLRRVDAKRNRPAHRTWIGPSELPARNCRITGFSIPAISPGGPCAMIFPSWSMATE